MLNIFCIALENYIYITYFMLQILLHKRKMLTYFIALIFIVDPNCFFRVLFLFFSFFLYIFAVFVSFLIYFFPFLFFYFLYIMTIILIMIFLIVIIF